MKIKNQKRTKRRLTYYMRNFGLQSPYTVLVDGTFCSAAQEAKVHIKDQIPRFLDDEKTKFVTTPCIIMEVEKLGKFRSSLYGTWLIVKQFGIVKCGHEGKPVPASECIWSLLKKNNPDKFIVALQDTQLKNKIREKAVWVPLISLSKQAPILEKPTYMCEEVVKDKYSSMSQYEETALKAMKRKYLGEDESETPEPKKKKKKKLRKRSRNRNSDITEKPQEEEGKKKGRGRHKKKQISVLDRINQIF